MAILYVVGTPIGNLADITERAVTVLRSVDLIACEDTRHSRILLDRYKITTPTVSYHQHSSLQKIEWLVAQLAAGQDVALVTDAGTPGISDPGGVLVEKVHQWNAEASHAEHRPAVKIDIVSVPGPSSLVAALSIAGFPADSFLFLGFLPKKKGRQSLLRSLVELDKRLGVETIVFFESAVRIERSLVDLSEAFGPMAAEVEVCIGRELTKKFEEVWRGDLPAAVAWAKQPTKGEMVVIIHKK